MSIEFLRKALLGCGLINYAIVLIWVFVTIAAYDWMRDLCVRLFRLSPGEFGAVNFMALVLYKAGIWMFFLIPSIVLYILEKKGVQPSDTQSVD